MVTDPEENPSMIKKWIYYTSIALVVAFISSGFKPNQHENQSWFYLSEDNETPQMFPSAKVSDYPVGNLLYTGKSYTGFKEAIAFKESQGQYKLINSLGYMGKYQFGVSALKAIGIANLPAFLNNPLLQEKAFKALLEKNKWELKDEILRYEGKIIGGVKVTESGILAAAHLGGAGSVKKFFKSNGTRFIKDDFGTSIRSYMRAFGGYDTSFIVANDAPTVIH
ncbi:peptidoglycan-binding protein LysM [Flavobacterium sp. 3HN19-14]|uniref:peptidoglycan-binding protein LysM n=1 Tax=Flavobacterium sp. 3HN19-14 TaxID=3448133 RepID=UPI003EE0AC73